MLPRGIITVLSAGLWLGSGIMVSEAGLIAALARCGRQGAFCLETPSLLTLLLREDAAGEDGELFNGADGFAGIALWDRWPQFETAQVDQQPSSESDAASRKSLPPLCWQFPGENLLGSGHPGELPGNSSGGRGNSSLSSASPACNVPAPPLEIAGGQAGGWFLAGEQIHLPLPVLCELIRPG